MEISVPATIDDIQEMKGKLEIPQIRVWCNPHKLGKNGDHYYHVFGSFNKALKFIERHPEAEKHPLIAFKGFEMDIFQIKEEEIDYGIPVS